MENNHFKKLSGMKRNNINSILKLGILSLTVAFVGSSCVKSVSGRTDFSNLAPTVLIPEGGMQNFGSNAILFPPTDPVDTTFFHLNYAATNVAPQDEVITIGIDDQALADYNALGGAQYEKFPDSIYSFTTTTVTVPKGANYSSLIPLVMFPDKINLLKNYMLPISITAAPTGATISSNYKTIYFHLIGNPIAGLYNWDFSRWNTQDGSGSLSGFSFFGQSTVIAPVDGTTAETPSGYFTQPRYEITFTNTGGVLSNFKVSFNSADLDYMSANGVELSAGPNIITADPVNGIYEFQWVAYVPGGPAYRYLIDKIYK